MKANQIRNLARKSVGVYISAKAMELKQTIKLIQLLDSEIAEIEEQIQSQVQDSSITTIPGISFKMAAMIQAEVGDFNRFSSPDKILAFAGLSPTKQKWINAVLSICVMLSSTLLNMSAFGVLFSKIITEKNVAKANIILPYFLTLLKNFFASSSTSVM